MPLENDLIDGVGFCAEYFFDGTVRELSLWIGGYFEDKNFKVPDQFLLLLRINHPYRIKAESSLVAFLKNAPNLPESVISYDNEIGRNVDWGETYVRSLSPLLVKYYNRNTVDVVDQKVLSSLSLLAKRWRDELVQYKNKFSHLSDFSSRIKDLDAVLPDIRGSKYSVPYDHNISAMLRMTPSGEELALLIDRESGISSKKYIHEEDGGKFQELFENAVSFAENNDSEFKILELIATFSILSAAINNYWVPASGVNYGWGLLREGLELKKNHENIDYSLLITKGAILSDDEHNNKEDRSLDLRRSIFGGNPSGKQPDLCLRFSCNQSNRQPVYVLGDAKLNDKTGKDYYAPSFWSLINNMMCYGHRMDLKFPDNTTGPGSDFISSPINPCGLLFFKQLDSTVEKDNDTITVLSYDAGDLMTNENSLIADVFGRIEGSVFNYFAE